MGHYSTRHVLDITRDLLVRNDDTHLGRIRLHCHCEVCGARRATTLPAGRFYLDHAHGHDGRPGSWSLARACNVPADVERAAAELTAPTRQAREARRLVDALAVAR